MTTQYPTPASYLATRDQALLEVLRDACVHNEDGGQMNTFSLQGRDSLDFTSISRTKLRRMLNDAYAAGHKAGCATR